VGKRTELTDRIAAEFAVFEPYYRAIAVSVALVLAAASIYSAWDFASRTAWNEARIRFDFRARQIGDAISGRMLDYEQVLRGAVGLFAASHNVERREWQAYVQQLRIDGRYSGIEGIGFALRVGAEQKALQEHSLRGENHRDFAIRPQGEHTEYFPVTSIEPYGRSISDSDLASIGVDMLSEPVCRDAMERARETGMPAISDAVTLRPGSDGAGQTGFLMFLPVYRQDAELATVGSRNAALTGYVFALFRVNELMQGILGAVSDVRVQLFDGAPGRTATVL
jgi:CHASE1-domain containing sensor protein